MLLDNWKMGSGLNEMGIGASLNFICPKCGSRDVVVKIEEKYYKFYKCNGCGFGDKEIVD